MLEVGGGCARLCTGHGMPMLPGTRAGVASALRAHCRLPAGASKHHSPIQTLPAWAAPAPARRSAAGARRRLAVTAAASAPAAGSSPLAAVGQFLNANFIPVGLLCAIGLGWGFPGPGVAAAGYNTQYLATTGVFAISGLLLQRREAAAAVRCVPALAFGLLSILLLTPLLSLAVLRLPIQPPEVALGLAVFCCMPTTLSTGVALTQACSGNSAVALLLTVTSNLLSVFTIPIALPLVLGLGAGVANFSGMALFKSLLATVLVPLLAGVAVQAAVPGVPEWCKANRRTLAHLSALCMCLVPWMQVSQASLSKLPFSVGSLAAAGLAGAGLHVVFLLVNMVATTPLRFDADAQEDLAIRKAVLLCTSEKTLQIAAAVLGQLSGVLGAAVGYAVIPCVLAHLIQIIMDSSLVSWWNGNPRWRAEAA